MISMKYEMASSQLTLVLSFVTVSLCSVVVLSEENVPIITWSNSKSLADVQPFAQETLYASLSNIVYNNEKIIVFTQEKMSFDDLAKYGGLYGGEGVLANIEFLYAPPAVVLFRGCGHSYEAHLEFLYKEAKNYSSTSASSVMLSVPYLPNLVSFLVDDLSILYKLGGAEYFTAKEIMTDDTEFVKSDCKLCVISLPEALSSSDRESVLTESDKFIGSVIGKDAIQQGKYIAMVTAKYSQMHSKQQQTLKRAARASQGENNDCTIPFLHCINDNDTVPCYFLMRFDQMVIALPNSTANYTIFKDARSVNGGITNASVITGCDLYRHPELDTTFRRINVTYTGVKFMNESKAEFVDHIKILIVYFLPINQSQKLPKGFWTLELSLTIMNGSINYTYHHLTYKKVGLPPYPLAIPSGASFHCSNATYCKESTTGDLSQCNDSSPSVVIRGLQVELFKKANQTEFSIAYDCEPYFNAASWMGILTLSILLPILIIGFFLVFQTQTMDRFDDPREPPLATTVLE